MIGPADSGGYSLPNSFLKFFTYCSKCVVLSEFFPLACFFFMVFGISSLIDAGVKSIIS